MRPVARCRFVYDEETRLQFPEIGGVKFPL